VELALRNAPALESNHHPSTAPHRLATVADKQGYALIEYAQKEEAEKAIKETSGTTFLEKTIHA